MTIVSKQDPATSSLPEGTITFLFTDIEGSTQLLQRLEDQYAEVLAEQRSILRKTFENWDGSEVDTQGDAFFVAFKTASDAVTASAEAQQAMAKNNWPADENVRLRMGLHTGEARVEDGGYVGMDVHRAARICSAGHGGQVLLSQTTRDLVHQNLGDRLRLQDMGEHRLKDLKLPERLFQLTIWDLPSDFPSLKSLDALPNNLPVQLTSFIGRDDEMQQVLSLLDEARLVTLTGPGGVGKTRLSLQVAAEQVEAFPHGVWYVELAPLDSAEHIAPAVANALNFPMDSHSSDLDPKSQLLDYLGTRSLLLVMDNFEHLVDKADLITEMLKVAPAIKLLVTSREKLNLQGEWTFDVPGMTYPQNGGGAALEEYSALQFFEVRARQADPSFDIQVDGGACATRVCQLVEGMPLCLELAASWVNTLTCDEIAKEIESGLDFLATSGRDVPEKHRSMRAVFDQSWGLLSEEHMRGFSALSVIRGGFDREAALAIAGVDLSMLSEFVNKSLLRRSGDGRYEMHELLRQYAGEALETAPTELEAANDAHSRYYIGFLDDRGANLLSENMLPTRDEVRSEISNIRKAIRWAVIHWREDEGREALMGLSTFYVTQGYSEASRAFRGISDHLRAEGAGIEPGALYRSLLLSAMAHETFFGSVLGDPDAVKLSGQSEPGLRELGLDRELALCLHSIGVNAEYAANNLEAVGVLDEGLALARSSLSEYWVISFHLWLGWAHYELGDYDSAGKNFQEAYEVCKRGGGPLIYAYTLGKLGTWADARHEYVEAMDYHKEALHYFTEAEDMSGQGYSLSRMSLSAWGQGDFQSATEFGKDGFEAFESIGHRWGMATSMCRAGFGEIGLDLVDEARESFLRGLEGAMKHEIVSTAIYAIIGLGAVSAREGDEERAVELLAFALNHPSTPALYKEIGQGELKELEAKLSAESVEDAAERGKSLELDDLAEKFLGERKVMS